MHEFVYREWYDVLLLFFVLNMLCYKTFFYLKQYTAFIKECVRKLFGSTQVQLTMSTNSNPRIAYPLFMSYHLRLFLIQKNILTFNRQF